MSIAALAIGPGAAATTAPLFGSLADPTHSHTWAGYQGEWVDRESSHHSLFRIDGVWRRGHPRYDRFYGAHWLPGVGAIGIGRQRPLAPILLFGQGMTLLGAQVSVEHGAWWGGGLVGRLQESHFSAGVTRFDDPVRGVAWGGRLLDQLEVSGTLTTWSDDASGRRMRSAVLSLRTPTWKNVNLSAAYGALHGAEEGPLHRRQALQLHATLHGPEYLAAFSHQRRGASYSRPEDIRTSAGFQQYDSSGRLRLFGSWEWSHQSRTARSSNSPGAPAWQSFLREEVQWRGDRVAEIATLQLRHGETSQARLGLRTQLRDQQERERAEAGVYARVLDDGRFRWDEVLASLSGSRVSTDWHTRLRIRHPVFAEQRWPTLSASLHLNRQFADRASYFATDLLFDFVPDRDQRQRSSSNLRLRGRKAIGPRGELSAAASGRATWGGSSTLTFNGTTSFLANEHNRIELSSSLLLSHFPDDSWHHTPRFGLLWNQAFGGPKNRIWRGQLLPSLLVHVIARPKTGGPQAGVSGVAITLNGGNTALTDAQGWARFERLDPGSIEVAIDTVGLGPNYHAVTPARQQLLLRAATTRTLPIEMETSSSILVVAWNDVDEAGALPYGYIPIPAIPLLVDGVDGFETDSSGVVFLPDQTPTSHTVALDTVRLDPVFHFTRGTERSCYLRPGDEAVLDFGLRAYGQIRGRVVLQADAAENPRPAPGPLDIYANGHWLTATDAFGNFSCEAPVGTVELQAKLRQLPRQPIAPTSNPQRTQIRPHTLATATIVLPRHSRLRARIVSQSSSFDPLGIPIEIIGGSFQYTSDTGEALFDPLEPATVTIRLLPDYVPEGYELDSPAEIQVELHRGSEAVVEFRIKEKGEA
jgi:hypothetical protein